MCTFEEIVSLQIISKFQESYNKPKNIDIKINNYTEKVLNCDCWNNTISLKFYEPECHCSGESIIEIPKNLFPGVQRL